MQQVLLLSKCSEISSWIYSMFRYSFDHWILLNSQFTSKFLRWSDILCKICCFRGSFQNQRNSLRFKTFALTDNAILSVSWWFLSLPSLLPFTAVHKCHREFTELIFFSHKTSVFLYLIFIFFYFSMKKWWRTSLPEK